MKNKSIVIPGFVLLAFIQLAVPAKMISDQEDLLQTGKEYRFKTAPIDPTDPFRGKYLQLSFVADQIEVANPGIWHYNEKVFASLKTDKNGFAVIKGIANYPPDNGIDYFETRISNSSNNGPIAIYFPFDKLYVEESVAKDAEDIYRQVNTTDMKEGYAIVKIKDGKTALQDVEVEGKSIVEWAKDFQKAKRDTLKTRTWPKGYSKSIRIR